MKIRALYHSIVVRAAKSHAGLFIVASVIACTAMCAHAANIFDEDWAPPKGAVQPHAVAAQTRADDSIPAPRPTPGVIIPPATGEVSPVAQTRRHEIPGKLDQARSRALLKEAFAAQLKDRSLAARKKLAQALLDEVPKAADNLCDEYVMLGGAIDASKDAANLRTCFAAADILSAQYEINGLAVKIEAVLKVNLRGDSPATASENVKAALELIDPLLAAEDFQTAARILAMARAAGDAALAPVVQKRIQNVETLRVAHDRLALHVEKLKSSPDDPAANLAVGSYACFNKGDWEKGLPMLARGSDANLKQLAALDLSRPTRAEDVIRLADGWWDLAGKQPEGLRAGVRQHAATFYQTALEGATGMRRLLFERRIADAPVNQSSPRPTSSRKVSDVFVNSIGMKFVTIKAGEFMMGDPPAAPGNSSTVHHVKITRSFQMAVTTVTNAQWKAVMGINPQSTQGDNHPAAMITWSEAVAFCEKLSAKERKHYRLPTEAEWEYACRAGTQTAYSFGDGKVDDFSWYRANSGLQPHDVASKKPNGWGLYDMHGNVLQWCSDGYGPYEMEAVDPKGSADTSYRILRGGQYSVDAIQCRSAYRNWAAPDRKGGNWGFRVCLEF